MMNEVKPEKIDLIEKSPVNMLLVKIEEVLAACATLKARVDIMEDHLVFLLSQNPKYLDMIQKKKAEMAETKANDETDGDQKQVH
jgi:hypothetical protein